MLSSNFSGMPDENDIKRAETNINESSKDHGLFILGIFSPLTRYFQRVYKLS